MMKRLLVLMVFSFCLLGGMVFELTAEEYYYGAIREDSMPEWILPSPEIIFNGNPAELDEAVDNSEGLPPVGNQSSQGSCTAWASAYYYLTYLQGQEYGWDLSEPAHQCSPAFTYNMINGGVDGGSQPSDAFKLFEDGGCGTMEDMPYTAANCTRFPSEESFYNGIKFKTLQSYEINIRNNNGRENLKNHIRNGGIAVTAMTVWENFNNISNYDYTYCVSEVYGNDPGGHAVTIVGFDEERETSDGMGAFRLVNSWGSGWGDDGFFWMSEAALSNDLIGWGYALYASDRIGHEPTLVARINHEHSDHYELSYWMGFGNPNNPEEEIRYFNFRAGARAAIELPGNTLVLDLSDIAYLVEENSVNEFYLEIRDDGAYNNHSGIVNSLVIEDISRDHRGISRETPVVIADDYSTTRVSAVLQFDAVPPTQLNSDLDLSTGEVEVSWQEIEETDGFIEYVIYRNNQAIGTSTGSSFVDHLEEFGIYNYKVTSHWQETDSWPTEEVQINYIEPVATSFTGVMTVEGETGEYDLAWEILRDCPISYDDGSAESSIYPNENASRGTMVGQRFTAPAAGKVVRVGAYFMEQDNRPMGRVRFALLEEGQGDIPGEVYYLTETFVPEGNSWHWLELTGKKMPLDNPGDFWVAVVWEDLGLSVLGRDIDGEQNFRMAITLDGENWIHRQTIGNPMIRVDYGIQEFVNGWTGLLGFNVYMNNELIENIDNDTHRCYGYLPEPDVYEFRVDALYQQGVWEGQTISIEWDGSTMAVGEELLPLSYMVSSAYPNPFNPSTVLDLQLPATSKVRVEVFNMLGQRVSVLVDANLRAGNHRISFNANELASGVYMLRTLVPGHINNTQKVVFMR